MVGIEIVDVHRVLDDVVTELVGLAVDEPRFHAAAREPHAEVATVVIAPKLVFSVPWANDVRPNSVPKTTSVSSSSPRCFRSLTSAADG